MFVLSFEIFFYVTFIITLAQSQNWPPDANIKDGDVFDYVIVGAGSAGAVIANRLSEDEAVRVLLIEAGGDPPQASVIPGRLSELLRTQYDYNYTSQNDGYSSLVQKGGSIPLSRAKMLGGCSSMNFMFYVRGNPEDYNEWASLGFKGWEWDSVLPYFKKSENNTDNFVIDNPKYSPYHSNKGPMKVSKAIYDVNIDKKLDTLLEGLSEVGFETLEDYNGPNQFGASRSYFSHSLPPGVRSSTAESFLKSAANRRNLFVKKHAYVTKVLIKKYEAVGVEILINNKLINIYTKKEVIVSAGAFNSPKILMASGIGPRTEIEKLNKFLVSDLAVGRNLQDHLNIPIAIVGAKNVDFETNDEHTLDSLPFPTVNGFTAVNGGNKPDLQLVSFYVKQNLTSLGTILFNDYFNYRDEMTAALNKALSNHELFIHNLILLHPKSRGNVTIAGTSATDNPIIYTGLLSNSEDIETMKKAAKLVAKTTETTYLKSIGAKILKLPLPKCEQFEYLSDNYWECYLLNLSVTVWHPASTCAMGKVVDQDLKVYGVKNLRVADASVMPTMPSGNTNAPVIMLGEKAADLIKSQNL